MCIRDRIQRTVADVCGCTSDLGVYETNKKILFEALREYGYHCVAVSYTHLDNWAIKSTAQRLKEKGKHIITSKIEHHAVLNSCAYLETQGFEVTYLDVDEWGCVRFDALQRAIRKDTILISIMYANNEVGTIQPIEPVSYTHLHSHRLSCND